MGLTTYLDSKPRAYHGPELRPHFILEQYRVYGTALVAFVGPCDVKTGDLVDWEDRLQSDHIRAAEMIHFLGEFFGATLAEGVAFQRLFAAIVRDVLAARSGREISRSGDDLYCDGRKMTVSIVAKSVVSCVLHFGLNWDATGAPVAAAGVGEWMELPAREALVQEVLTRAAAEWDSIQMACVKVRPV